MSVIHLDGFDWIPTTTNIATLRGYMAAAGWYQSYRPNNDTQSDVWGPKQTDTGRFGFGNSVRFNNDGIMSGYGQLYFLGTVKPFVSPASTVFFNAAVRRNSTAEVKYSNNGSCVGFYSANQGYPTLVVSTSPNGILRVWQGDSGSRIVTNVISSAPGVFFEDVWFNLQIGVTPGTTGSLQVRVNTETVIDVPVMNINAGDCMAMGGIYGGGLDSYNFDTNYDDLYLNDSAGAVHNGFLNNLRVKTQAVIANGAHIDSLIGGTSPAATNWQSVDVVRTDDSKYVYSPTIGAYDVYDLNPNQNAPYARAVQVRVIARQDDATQRSIKTKMKSGATYSSGTRIFYLNQNYSHWTDIWELNPDTGVEFTGTEVNALEVGYEIYS